MHSCHSYAHWPSSRVSLQSVPQWETDSKISCEQTLQKGEGPKTAWTRELTNDGELILVIQINDNCLCFQITNATVILVDEYRQILYFTTSIFEPSVYTNSLTFVMFFCVQTMSAGDVVCTRVYERE